MTEAVGRCIGLPRLRKHEAVAQDQAVLGANRFSGRYFALAVRNVCTHAGIVVLISSVSVRFCHISWPIIIWRTLFQCLCSYWCAQRTRKQSQSCCKPSLRGLFSRKPFSTWKSQNWLQDTSLGPAGRYQEGLLI